MKNNDEEIEAVNENISIAKSFLAETKLSILDAEIVKKTITTLEDVLIILSSKDTTLNIDNVYEKLPKLYIKLGAVLHKYKKKKGMNMHYTKEQQAAYKKENFLAMKKTDFNKSLISISKEEFTKAFFTSLDGHIGASKKHMPMSEMAKKYIYVYFDSKYETELRVQSVENVADADSLICKEKLSAFYSSSSIGREAFYLARILKPIREKREREDALSS